MSEKLRAFNKLGLAFNASQDEVKEKYYTLAKRLHPDAQDDDDGTLAKKFAEVSEAFKTAYVVAKIRDEYKEQEKKYQDTLDPVSSYTDRLRKQYEEEAAGIINFSRSRYEMKWNNEVTGNSGVDWGGYFWAVESGMLDTNKDKKALPKPDTTTKSED